MIASSTASEIWSHILSGWPSVTDSEVKKNFGELAKVVVICMLLDYGASCKFDELAQLHSRLSYSHVPIRHSFR